MMDAHDDPIHDYNGDFDFDFDYAETIKSSELEKKNEEDKEDLTEVHGELKRMIMKNEGSSYSYTYSNAVTPQVFQ